MQKSPSSVCDIHKLFVLYIHFLCMLILGVIWFPIVTQCMMHLEDRLKDIYFKSVVLSESMRVAAMYSQQELTHVLG